jgi:hypothetical protein
MPLNGYLTDLELAFIPGTFKRVKRELVPQTDALRKAFYKRFGKVLIITDAYRSYSEQVQVKAAKGWLAATPGFSNHGWGTAIDFGSGVNSFTSEEYRWMRANAPRFGWYAPTWARPGGSKPEPWHWEAILVHVSSYSGIPGVDIDVSVPGLPNPLEDELKDDERNALFHLIALLGETPHRTAQQVHNWPVSRVEGAPTTFLGDQTAGVTAALSAAAQIAGLTAAVQALAGAHPATGIDPATITAAAEQGARAALEKFKATVRTELEFTDLPDQG